MTTHLKAAIVAAALMAAGAAMPARAADDAMKVCGQKYQAAKAAKTLPANQTWAQFLAQCRATLQPAAAAAPAAKPAMASAPAKPAPAAAAKPAAAPKTAPGEKTPNQIAAQQRMHECAAQWKADKAANKIPAGQTWPKYWSACSKRLKG